MTTREIYNEYLLNVASYLTRKKINGLDPNEWLMRSIEEKLEIKEIDVDDFRHYQFEAKKCDLFDAIDVLGKNKKFISRLKKDMAMVADRAIL